MTEEKEGFWVNRLTPKDTEEIKPGLFIQKWKGKYRQVHPGAWDGKINTGNLLFGGNFWKSFIWFVIIIFLAWSFQHDTAQYKDFYENVRDDPIAFCAEVKTALDVTCSEQNERNGLCTRNIGIVNFSFGDIGVIDDSGT